MPASTLDKIIDELVSNGLISLLNKGLKKPKRKVKNRVQKDPFNEAQEFFNEHGLNICHNIHVPEQYDPELENILVATESPAYVKQGTPDNWGAGENKDHSGWIDDKMEFVAEISWEKYTDSEVYHCPRKYYVNHDGFVEYGSPTGDKSKLVSHVYSNKRYTTSHRFRHQLATEFESAIDNFGSGTGSYLPDKSDALCGYQFNIAVENCLHENYLTEKFFDPIKTKTIPIYRGGESSVRKLGFDTDGVLFFETMDELEKILDDIDNEMYNELKSAAEYNRKRLRELRNEEKLGFYYSPVQMRSMKTWESYNQNPINSVPILSLIKRCISPEYDNMYNVKLD